MTGIGGIFFRAKDPQALAAWYAEHLGVGTGEYGSWDQQAGHDGLFPVRRRTPTTSRPTKQWMLNFRVEGLDALKAELAGQGHRGRHQSRMGHAGGRPVRADPRPRGQPDRAVGARLKRVTPSA